MKRNLLISLMVLCSLVLTFNRAEAQISFTAMDVAYTQNFDWWGSEDRYFSDNSGDFPGFYSFRTVDNVQPQFFRAATTGGSTFYGGNFFSFGEIDAPSERACGLIYASNTGPLAFGFRFKNNTGATIASIEVSFTGEQWGVGNTATSGGSTVQTLWFDYLQGAEVTDLSSGSYTRVPALFFDSPVPDGNRRALNGNLESNRAYLSGTIEVTIPPGEEIMLRWIDDTDDRDAEDNGVYDHRMGIDDLVVTPRSTVTGVDDTFDSSHGVNIYPNPVRDIITIDAGAEGVESVSVYNMAGKRVISGRRSFESGVAHLNVGEFPAGMYVLEIITPAGKRISRMYIKE